LALCLAALRIRRELLDLCRHYFGPHGVAANHESARIDGKMDVWKPGRWMFGSPESARIDGKMDVWKPLEAANGTENRRQDQRLL
jgi:hypothetical protein